MIHKMSWLVTAERVMSNHRRERDEMLLHDRLDRCSNRSRRKSDISQNVQRDPVAVKACNSVPTLDRNKLGTHSKNSLRIWYAPKVGSLRMVYEIGGQRKKSMMAEVAYEIPHDLACHISPANQDASRAHCASVFSTRTRAHEPLTALVRPRHHISHRLGAFSKTIHHAAEFDLQ